MENYARDLEKELIEAGPFENNFSKRVKRWDILFVGDDGKVISIPWLKKFVAGACLISVVFLIVLVSMLVLYGSSLKKNSDLIDTLKMVESQNLILEKDIERLKVMLVGVGANMNEEGKSEIETPSVKPEMVATEKKEQSVTLSNSKPVKENNQEKLRVTTSDKDKMVAKKEKVLLNQNVKKGDGEEKEKSVSEKQPITVDEKTEPATIVKKPYNVAVEGFTVSLKEVNNSLRIRFTVKNISNEIEPISGNIFVILKPGTDDPMDWVPIPSVNLVAGKPAESRKGQFFSIRRFKPVRFIITDRADYKKFKDATVFVYARSGELVTQKTFPLNL